MVVIALAAWMAPCTGIAGGSEAAAPGCHVGAYQLSDGEIIDINASSAPGVVRWHSVDGRTGTLERSGDGLWRGRAGWTSRDEPLAVGFGNCGAGRITFGDHDEHGIVEFKKSPDGTRTRTRYADGYVKLSMDFIRDGIVQPNRYGRARVASSPMAPSAALQPPIPGR